jgi:tRNA U34 5-carboxymethylaminomethyl modifying enzyme MnmG/GidA
MTFQDNLLETTSQNWQNGDSIQYFLEKSLSTCHHTKTAGKKVPCKQAFSKKVEVTLEFESYVTKRHQSIVLNTESENLEFSST